jgi:hypothetical protein
MAQSLEVNIKTTSDLPQAMDKAKAAVSNFDKQIEGINKKFTNSFKEIFISFLGPIAIVYTVLGYINKMIAENQRKREEAHQAAINNTNELMSAEDRYYENKRANEKKDRETKEQAKLTREEVTEDFLRNDPRGRAIMEKYQLPSLFPTFKGAITGKEDKPDISGFLSGNKKIQAEVQALIAADIAKNPTASSTSTGPTSFRGPEGFSNVVGVGSNPVIEAMTLQLEEARKQTALLESLNSKQPGGGVPVDFTKTPSTNNPSLRGGK